MSVVQESIIDKTAAKVAVDAVLTGFFAQQIGRASTVSPDYARLWTTMARLNQAGGKRLRPYMAMLSYQIFGGRDDITEAATSWELLHLCMLIHDDVIDNDTTRYGVANVAGEYEHVYAVAVTDPLRRSHLAASMAILAGDVALSSAHQLIVGSDLLAEQKITALGYIADATFAVTGGELLDTESVLHDMAEIDAATIAEYKTASYSFVGPLLMGADLAGAGPLQLDMLRNFGRQLGCAYQLVDDLLGVFGDPAETGKSVISDIREGKRTLLIQHAFARATADDLKLLNDLVGNQAITDQQAEQVRNIIESGGAKQAVVDMIDNYAQDCRQIVAELSAQQPATIALLQLVDSATKRRF